MTEVTRGFCDIKILSPGGCLPLSCGFIHLLNHEKLSMNSEVEQMTKVINIHVDIKMLALMGCLPPPKGYIHVENHKKCA